MRVECVVETNDSVETVKDRLLRFYTAIGYTRSGDPDALVFRRGSVLRAMVSLSPKTWRTVVEARISRFPSGRSSAVVTYDVRTTGQHVTEGEVGFWEAEFAAMDEAVAAGYFRPEDSHAAAKSAVRGNWGFFGRMLLMLPLAILAATPLVGTAYLVARPFARALLGLIPIIGEEGLSLLCAFLSVIAFAGLHLFPIPQLIAWLAKRQSRLGRPWATMSIRFILISAFWGLFAGLALTTHALVQVLKTDRQLIILGAMILGILAVALVVDWREKRAKHRTSEYAL